MKKEDTLKNMEVKALLALIEEKRQSLHNFRFGLAGSKVRNIKEGRNTRKEIARAMTEIRQRKNK